jgi:demethylmenaquinone methyltransferase/2-methoxy-6-polyprenyl-1,4-benzoquinol methylase
VSFKLPTAEARPRYVSAMFGRIARRYDLMNTLMTFGMDRGWRRYAAAAADPSPNGLALDVGAGTGKLAQALAERMPAGRVVACDLTEPMLRQGRSTLSGPSARRIVFQRGDALALPYRDAAFDCVSSAFTVRNLADIERGFREMARVTRQGGRVVCLEISRSVLPGLSALFRVYFRRLVPLLGKLVAGDAEAYTYLPESAEAFPAPQRVAEAMRLAGLDQVRWHRLGFGTVAVHVGVKP